MSTMCFIFQHAFIALLFSHFDLAHSLNVSSEFISITGNQFQGKDLVCNQSMPCSIICSKGYSCSGANVTCPSNNQCNITCSGYGSCISIIINPPKNQSLFSLSFTGVDSLKRVTYPIYPVDNARDFQLVCNVCTGMNIICPAHANCAITCIGAWSCLDVKHYIFSISGILMV